MHTILIAGAALVGLPILLHLIMKQEPKRLTFPAFRFLTQRLKTNQRKLRLRHFILLAMRMLLIALFCLALYQPTLLSERLSLVGEQPVAVVIVIDNSPSMGYTANEKTRLDEARRLALELLATLPDKSPVAVVPTADPDGRFSEPLKPGKQLGKSVNYGQWVGIAEARDLIEKLDKPRGGRQPVTSAISVAFDLFATVDQEMESSEPLPKFTAVFTDRTAASWNAADVDNLKKKREDFADPKPVIAVVDVGIDYPTNVGILAAEMKPQIISANQPAIITVTVAATGPATEPPVETVVHAKIDGANAEPKRVVVPYGQSRPVTFEFTKLKPGVHQVEFTLETGDRLMFDNIYYRTFRVGAARNVLTIAEGANPAELAKAAYLWQAAHEAKGEFGCLIVSPDKVHVRDGRTVVEYPNPEKPGENLTDNIREFEVVCLLSIKDPSERVGNEPETLWDKLRPYVKDGGKLLIVPGDENLDIAGYNVAGNDLMPGTIQRVINTRELSPPPPKQTAPRWPAEGYPGENGVTWYLKEDKFLQHPMLRPFQGWQQRPDVDAVQNPRRVQKYWEVKKADVPEASVVVWYNDAEKSTERRPAVLERGIPDPANPKQLKGKVVLLTTRMDTLDEANPWHDYWDLVDSTWYSVFPWLLERYLAGDTADAEFNHFTGEKVTVALPKSGLPRGAKVLLEGLGISPTEGLIEVGDKQTELLLGPLRTSMPGNFQLSVERWRDGFSLNVPAEESTLEKVPVEAIEELTGKDRVIPMDRNVSLRDAIAVKFNQPVDLFPWLLIAVLMLLAIEGLVANRFYRRVK